MGDNRRGGRIQYSTQIIVGFQQTEGMKLDLVVDEIQSCMTLDKRIGGILKCDGSGMCGE